MRASPSQRESRSCRIIAAPSERAVESRIYSYRRPVFFVWVGGDKRHRDRWVAKARPSAEHPVLCRDGGLAECRLDHKRADAELFHAGLGFTGMFSAGDRQGFGGSATSVRSPTGPLKFFDLVMNYRTKTQWPRHLA